MPRNSPSVSTQLLQRMDPRRSLVAGLIWLVVALAASFAIAASWWVGRVARQIVVQQHVRRLVLETDQLGSDLGQAVSVRATAVRASGARTPLDAYADLVSTYPDLGWIALADAAGRVVGSDGTLHTGVSVADAPWFSSAQQHPWIGVIEGSPASSFSSDSRSGSDSRSDSGSHSSSSSSSGSSARSGTTSSSAGASGHAHPLGDIALPLKDSGGRTVAVVAAHLTWPWTSHDLERLSASLDPRGDAETLVLDERGIVRVGPAALLNRPWSGVIVEDAPAIEPSPTQAADRGRAPRFERLPGGAQVLVARAALAFDRDDTAPGWQVQLSEPKEQVYQRANALGFRILWISISLGAATALIGALAARHLTNRLRQLTRSAAAVGRDEFARIEVPPGHDEVAKLAAAFAKVLDDLREERGELRALSTELERRVAVRTREVERLAEESRYAAIVRERLKIARDLHDTLAHSMMAMLSEIRLLRKLQIHDPASVAGELAHAEEVAHEGLNEARTAITQMRVNAVRDTGLGAALASAFERFLDHTGLAGEFRSEPEASRFGDERAETVFRMAEELLRNIERHAMANRVLMTLETVNATHLSLRIDDDGVGFDTRASRPGHYGLVGLREMTELIGAELFIDSGPNRGTVVTVTLRMVPEML